MSRETYFTFPFELEYYCRCPYPNASRHLEPVANRRILVDVSVHLKDEWVPFRITRKVSKDFPYARWRSDDADLGSDFVRQQSLLLPEKPNFATLRPPGHPRQLGASRLYVADAECDQRQRARRQDCADPAAPARRAERSRVRRTIPRLRRGVVRYWH